MHFFPALDTVVVLALYATEAVDGVRDDDVCVALRTKPV
jgi:hypothetical protein